MFKDKNETYEEKTTIPTEKHGGGLVMVWV